ncbi:MAG: MFS transporter [Acidobacteria bacterium]|nr:MFS transporter [Acidobacteriota bacterium]
MPSSAPAAPRSVFHQVLDVRRNEWPQALLMSSYFFLVITTFWILKPLKKGQFVEFYEKTGVNLAGWMLNAAQAEQIAKVANMFVALVAAWTFAALARKMRREKLTYVFSAGILAAYALFASLLSNPGAVTVWSFYFFGDLYSTLMVAAFFAFLNDSVDSDAAKRLYGLIGLGGVAGGAFGTTVLSAYIRDVSMPSWLWICFGIGVAIVLIAGAAARAFGPRPAERSAAGATAEPSSSALEGAGRVLRSRYLLAIVAIVGLYEMVSTIMDFQFTSTVLHFTSGEEISRQFAQVFAITNWVALFVQLFLTSFVMTRFGVGTALLVLPGVALFGSAGFLVFPALWTGSFLNTADNGFSYSINQSAKEALYVPTGRTEKYQAKAFIDMFVQRFAKAMAVGLSLAITTFATGFEGVRWLSLLTGLILLVWLQAARFAGREFDRLTAEKREQEAQPAEEAAAQVSV